MGIFNQFSYPLLVIVLGVMLFIGLSPIPRMTLILRLGIVTIYAVIMIAIGLAFQYPDSPVEAESVADVEDVLSNGTSTFVMLYSNY